MALTYLPFAKCSQLLTAASNQRPLRSGQRGPGIRVLQGALIDLGFKLPRSTRATGPDGIFGVETGVVVVDFQTSRKLKPDGLVGRDMMAALDKEMVAKAKPPQHQPPVVIPPNIPGDYVLGTADPPLRHDAGAGRWNSQPTEASYIGLKLAILDVLPPSTAVLGRDAAAHMFHYLGNSGRDYVIDLEGMVKDVPSARQRYEREVNQAQRFVESLAVGTYEITSVNAENGYNRKVESTNWFYAIGGYSTWGKGRVAVKQSGSQRSFSLDYDYRFFDRYNWDGGKKVTIYGLTITDHFMGEFHRQGIAREFDCYGSFHRHLTWRQGDIITGSQLYGAADNRA